MAAGQLWRVVGGGGSGGVVVREQRGTASPEAGSRLCTGSVVRELAVERGRLHYELLAGEGPSTGWVTVRLGGRDLVVPVSAGEAAAATSRRSATALSRRRIAEAGSWHEVLAVPPSASADEVKRAHRELALLHHPDKQGAEAAKEGGGEGPADAGEVFRRVQRAYEEGLADAARRAPKGARRAGEVVAAERALCPVAINAPREQLRAACDDFEDRVNLGTSRSVPDDVPYVDAEQVAQWMLEGRCIPIDAREPGELFGPNAARIPGAVPLGYTRLLKSPETVTAELARLKKYADAGLRLVAYSLHGSPSNGNHSIVCCLLVDVFGFDADIVNGLEDGFLMWQQWARRNQDTFARIQTKYGGT